jgi:hypothetical protein
MAFIPEDGSIVAGANSYVSLSFADTFHTDRGNTAWTGNNEAKQAALIKATDYIEQVYNGRWKGILVDDAQALSWPRYGAGPETDEIPTALKQAVCILALESIGGDELNPVLDRAIKREKVGPLETEFMDGTTRGKTRPAISGLLRSYVTGSAINGTVVRV